MSTPPVSDQGPSPEQTGRWLFAALMACAIALAPALLPGCDDAPSDGSKTTDSDDADPPDSNDAAGPQPEDRDEAQGPGVDMAQAYASGDTALARELLMPWAAALDLEVGDHPLGLEEKISSLGVSANVLAYAFSFEGGLTDQPVPGEQVALARALLAQINTYAGGDVGVEDRRLRDVMRFARQERDRMTRQLVRALRDSHQDAFADALAQEFEITEQTPEE